MALAQKSAPAADPADLLRQMEEATDAVDAVFALARGRIASLVTVNGKLSSAALDREQHVVHGLSWLATYAATLRAVTGWAQRLVDRGLFGETERLLSEIVFGEYLNHVAGGIPMNQQEFVRLADFGLTPKEAARLDEGAAGQLRRTGSTRDKRARLAAIMAETGGRPTVGACGLDDTLEQIRAEMQRFVAIASPRTPISGTSTTPISRSRSSKNWPALACSG